MAAIPKPINVFLRDSLKKGFRFAGTVDVEIKPKTKIKL